METAREIGRPQTGASRDYDPLTDLIGDARFVLLGEASHGTHEFYHERAVITERLIQEKGFAAVAVEGDWPDAYGSTATSAGRAPTLSRWRRSPTSGASRRGSS